MEERLSCALFLTSRNLENFNHSRNLATVDAQVARINGYGLATVAAAVAQGATDVEAKPVQAIRAQASDVLAVAVRVSR